MASVGARRVAAAARAPGAQAGARMAAWRVHAYGALSELRLDEARVPPLRAADELLVRVHSSSLNPLDVAMIGESSGVGCSPRAATRLPVMTLRLQAGTGGTRSTRCARWRAPAAAAAPAVRVWSSRW